MKSGAVAVGTATLAGGALFYGSQPGAAAEVTDTGASVVLDENEQEVTDAGIQPTIALDWDNISDGVEEFDVEIDVELETGLEEGEINDLLDDDIEAGTVVEDWNNKSDGDTETFSAEDFDTDASGSDNIDDVEATEGDFEDADGALEITTDEIDLFGDGQLGNFDETFFPEEIGDDEAAATRVELDTTVTVRDDSGGSHDTEVEAEYDSVEFGIVIDNPDGSADSDGIDSGSTADGE